ncbi:MAG TPA: hypothetical protein VKY92_03720 [Verrucomicrobiae bacterium]|nr:hypothetical protein [Verrucomicrobiae bacterium]
MNNSELSKALLESKVPEPPPGYWDAFPVRVLSQIQRHRENEAAHSMTAAAATKHRWAVFPVPRLAWLAGACAFCALAAFLLLFRPGRERSGDPQFAAAVKCFHEITGLFPNQVRTVVFDNNGPSLVLSEEPDIPFSQPVYVKIAGPTDEHRFVTFSGQQLVVHGETFEVLIDGQGGVLVVGKQSVWSSTEPGLQAGPYRIEARPLPTKS